MKNPLCPLCGSKLEHVRQGMCLEINCASPSCSFSAATTFPVPVHRDQTRYSLVIPPLQAASPAALAVLNRRFSHGIAVTRQLALRGELPPFIGSAAEIGHEAQRLRADGIPFVIDPDYPFDLDVPFTAFGPPDGPLAAPWTHEFA